MKKKKKKKKSVENCTSYDYTRKWNMCVTRYERTTGFEANAHWNEMETALRRQTHIHANENEDRTYKNQTEEKQTTE